MTFSLFYRLMINLLIEKTINRLTNNKDKLYLPALLNGKDSNLDKMPIYHNHT